MLSGTSCPVEVGNADGRAFGYTWVIVVTCAGIEEDCLMGTLEVTPEFIELKGFTQWREDLETRLEEVGTFVDMLASREESMTRDVDKLVGDVSFLRTCALF